MIRVLLPFFYFVFLFWGGGGGGGGQIPSGDVTQCLSYTVSTVGASF